jgi:hypothetical protein
MGFFKKIIRKVTRPISKVLDKVVPNEIKPLLPYAAAFAPYMLPAGLSFGSGIMSNPMIARAIASGGINALSQLSQEGNEGDLNAMSLGLSSLQGALGAENAGKFLRSKTTAGQMGTGGINANPGVDVGFTTQSPAIREGILNNRSFLQKTGDFGLNTLAKGADFIGESTQALKNPGLNMETLKAASVPLSLGTGDAMYNEAIKAQRQYELDLADYNQQQDEMMDIPGRSATFLKAYRAYGIDEDTIQDRMEGMDLIYTAPGAANGGIMGYNMGGRVGRAYGGGFGGIEAAVQTVKDRDLKENLTIAKDTDMDMKSLAQEFLATYKRQPNSYDELMEFYKKKNGYQAGGEEVVEEQVMKAANGGIMNARVPFVSGGFARGLINAAKFSDEAPLMLRSADEVPSGLVDEMGQPLRKNIEEVKVREMTGPNMSEFQSANRQPMGPGMLDYTAAGNPQMAQAADFIKSIRTSDGGIDYAIAEAQIGRGIKLKGNESIEELIELFLFKPNKKAIAAIGAGYGGLGAGAMMNDTSIQAANGGIMNYNMGGSVLPNGVEMDYRGGGFIPMGSKERADDVPARVSKNEFVMTADAVRAAGGGSVNKGAKKMYELMNNLEARA